ncbi:DUF262 domain-containing protein [Microbacterium sp. ZW T5_45]|uniref:DUF262 domain-containing protein n=1 Tax=Microbacterium sp. ZW T5_45 TaxID=3378080 RepID=UPI0038541B04
MDTSATNWRIHTIVTGIRDGRIKPDPNFQRRLVWSAHHKIALVRTVLEGLPFPEIFIAAGELNEDTGDSTQVIVDGQQRVSTLYQYFSGSEDFPELDGTDIAPYAGLSTDEKKSFLEYSVVVRDLGSLPEEETRRVFQRINSTSYSLNAMEINHSRFDGVLKKTAEHLAENDFFLKHNIFSALDGRRMNDVRYALTILITMMSGYFNAEDEHESYLEQYNDDFPLKSDLLTRLEAVFSLIEQAEFDSKSRVWRKADLSTAIIELDRTINSGGIKLNPSKLRSALETFYSEVSSAASDQPTSNQEALEYSRRVRAGVNQRMSRVLRGEIFSQVIRTAEEV